MFSTPQFIARHKTVAVAIVVAGVLLAGPVSGASAATHSAPAQHASTTLIVAPKVGLTFSQKQAYVAAQSYLRLGSGFSYLGLVGQLSSKYGSGFSKKDAIAAVKALHPNWNAQAVLSAKGYLKLGTGFSRSSLISQLTSKYGSQFTLAQAKYAVKKVGL